MCLSNRVILELGGGVCVVGIRRYVKWKYQVYF